MSNSNKTVTIDKVVFNHGDKVTCSIEGTKIEDAKISIESDRYYICQNHKSGQVANDRLGYKYSWVKDGNIKNLKLLYEAPKEPVVINDYQIF